MLQGWVLLSCTLILARVALLKVASRSDRLSPVAKRICATILTLMLACGLSSVFIFFNSVGLFERAMLSAIILGFCTASYSINMGYPPLLLAYLIPLMGTCAFMWTFNPHSDADSGLSTAIGVSFIALFSLLVRNGKFMFEVFALAIESSTKLEEQSKHLSEALHHAEDAKQAAETSSQSKTRFIAAASHDLRQPVHVLNLFSGALRNAKLDDRTRDIVDNMNVAVTSLSSQLNSLLDISELDSGSVKPDFRSVDLYQLAQTLMGEMRKLAEDKHIELISEVPRSLCVRTDPVMLSQIIRNLCGNAIKYTHTGSVRLIATENASQVTLSIIDTGIGIEISDSDKIFEEFYQVANHTRDNEKGLGLGLSIVERLIKTLEHKLTVESYVGRGTTINIALLRCDESTTHLGGNRQTEDTHRSMNLREGFWVHLVDDEAAVQNSVKAFLETVGAKVTTSGSSSSAIDFLSSHSPDAVLIDLRLQDGDTGLSVVDSIADMNLPIALITGQAIDESALASSYPDLLMLQKPVSDEALLDLLDYMLMSETQMNETQSVIPSTPAA